MSENAHRASLCLERKAILGFVLSLMPGSFRLPVMTCELNSDPVYWVRVLKDELHSVPFLTTLGGKSA